MAAVHFLPGRNRYASDIKNSVKMHPNNQHRTSNNQWTAVWFSTRCWVLDVRCWLFRFTKRKVPARPCGQFSFHKTKSPRPTLRSNRDKSGDGSAPSSLSHADIRHAPFGGCQLPDAILHGKRSLRPRGRAVQRLADTGFRVRLFSLLELMVAPPACKPDEDTSVI